jgi:thiosulfate/3-mercaptopyruvate sulfurtransferase
VVVADVRWYLDGRSGRSAYERGHLPGAVFVDLNRWLAAPASRARGRHPLPDPAVFAEGMASLGISNDSRVVAYDDAGGSIAARLVWLLRITSHAASILDGGIDGWTGSLETGEPSPARGAFGLSGWPDERFVDADDLACAEVVLDARARERFRGDVEPVDARAGHIPGAQSAPSADNLDKAGRFRSPDQLRRHYEILDVNQDTSPVVYCGSGVTACHDLLALELAGFGHGRLYVGSWSQWSADQSRPLETGG